MIDTKAFENNMLTQVNNVEPASHTRTELWFDERRRPALAAVLSLLDARGYTFTSATPATHARVVSRPHRQTAGSVRDVLGWSLPFERDLIDDALYAALDAAGALDEQADGRLKATLRASRVSGRLFLHSAYPTTAQDAVFLGPDSHRFALWIAARLQGEARTILDYGAGAGVGGITAAQLTRDPLLTLADINPKALFLAGINAAHAGLRHELIAARELGQVGSAFDLIVTHPPFMIDAGHRAYRDGGGLYGVQLSLDWALQAITMLNPGGRLILHTGVSIVDGRDVLLTGLRERLPAIGFDLEYVELDPDIFSEDLDQPGYENVDRIAAVGLVIRRTDGV